MKSETRPTSAICASRNGSESALSRPPHPDGSVSTTEGFTRTKERRATRRKKLEPGRSVRGAVVEDHVVDKLAWRTNIARLDDTERLVAKAWYIFRMDENELVESEGPGLAEWLSVLRVEYGDGLAFVQKLYESWLSPAEVESVLQSALETLGGFSEETYGDGPPDRDFDLMEGVE